MPFPGPGKKVEMIILTEVRWTGKDENHMISRLVKVAQLCPALCDPMDYTVHGILTEFSRPEYWVAFPFSRDLPNPSLRIAGRFFTS